MTYGILNSINKKNRLIKLLIKTDVNSDKYAALKATFKQYRETLRSSIKEAKRLYYHRTFLLYQNNIRKTWAVIKETLQRKKKHETPHEFVCNNNVITDMNVIANEFNRYFIGRSLAVRKKFNRCIPVKNILDRKLTLFLNSRQLMRIVLIKLLRNLNQNQAQAMITFQINSLNMPELF